MVGHLVLAQAAGVRVPVPQRRSMRPWLNWIERLATDQKVGGSSPPGRTMVKIKD